MATLRKKNTKDGYVWEVDFYFQGKRYRKSTKTSDKKVATMLLKDIEVKIAKGEFDFETTKRKTIKLSEFAEKYLNFSKATKAINTFHLDSHVLRILQAEIGDIYINHINHRMLEEFKLIRMEEVKPTSVNLEIRHLKSAFETAKKWEYII